jgi:hypothetical protein
MISRSFSAVLWKYEGPSAWFFASLPAAMSAEIRSEFGVLSPGWGSLPVVATVGKTSWKTSMFFDTKRDTYLLPVKAEVRKKERLTEGDTLETTVELDFRKA